MGSKVVAAIDLACAQSIAQLVGSNDATAYAIFVLVLGLHGALNATSVRLVAWLNDASATVHVVGVTVLAGWLFLQGTAHPVGYLAQAVRQHAPTASTPPVSLDRSCWAYGRSPASTRQPTSARRRTTQDARRLWASSLPLPSARWPATRSSRRSPCRSMIRRTRAEPTPRCASSVAPSAPLQGASPWRWLAMAGFAALLVALAALWVLWFRPRFAGPKVDLAHYESRPAPRVPES